MLSVLYLDPALDCGELGFLIDDGASSVEGLMPCLTADQWIDLWAGVSRGLLQQHAETAYAKP